MKITKMDVRFYKKPYDIPISNGKYTYYNTEIVICQVSTDEGITGVGWTHGDEMVLCAAKKIEPYIIGEDPINVERIWDKIYLPKIFGRKGLATRAISAVDIALWDIRGKAFGQPLYKMLGGFRKEVPVYVAGGYYETGKSNSGLQEEMEANLQKGIKAIKMKIGRFTIKDDLKRIEDVRKTVGDSVDILVDANNAYSRMDAFKIGLELDRLGVYWFEEPVNCDDIDGSAFLVDRINTPIALGENEYTRYGFRDIIAARATNVLNADAQILGGITEWKKVADLAAAYNMPLAPHGDQEIHVHLVASISNGLIVEYYDTNLNALLDRMFKTKTVLNPNGTVSPSELPGIGFEVNFDAIEEFLAG
jgi:D-arabinonate dehydratase